MNQARKPDQTEARCREMVRAVHFAVWSGEQQLSDFIGQLRSRCGRSMAGAHEWAGGNGEQDGDG